MLGPGPLGSRPPLLSPLSLSHTRHSTLDTPSLLFPSLLFPSLLFPSLLFPSLLFPSLLFPSLLFPSLTHDNALAPSRYAYPLPGHLNHLYRCQENHLAGCRAGR